MKPEIAGVAAFLVWALFIAAVDFRSRRIPNELLLIGIAGGFVAGLCVPGVVPAGGAASAFWGGVIGLALTIPGYALRKLGAGDAKYAAVAGCLGGLEYSGTLWLTTGILLGLLSLLSVVIARSRGISVKAVPAGVALSAGFVIVLLRHVLGD